MGARGVGTFENDGASDYAAEIAEGSDFCKSDATLDRALRSGDEYREAPDATEAAAADLAARLRNNSGKEDACTEKPGTWVSRIKPALSNDIAAQARRAVARVLSKPRELVKLWSVSEESDAGKSAVNDLRARLQVTALRAAQQNRSAGEGRFG